MTDPALQVESEKAQEHAMTGAERIAAERERQIEAEGYTAEHDRGHADELAAAGAAYATLPDQRMYEAFADKPVGWPWHGMYWKPTPDDRARELVKAGALIAAAIDALENGA